MLANIRTRPIRDELDRRWKILLQERLRELSAPANLDLDHVKRWLSSELGGDSVHIARNRAPANRAADRDWTWYFCSSKQELRPFMWTQIYLPLGPVATFCNCAGQVLIGTRIPCISND